MIKSQFSLKNHNLEDIKRDLRELHNPEFQARYGCSHSSLIYLRQKFKIPAPPREYLKLNPIILNLYEKQHLDIYEIRLKTRASLHYIKKVLAQAGYPFKYQTKKFVPLTPETVLPLDYTNRPQIKTLEPAEMQRFIELKRWKQAKYLKNLAEYKQSVLNEEIYEDERTQFSTCKR